MQTNTTTTLRHRSSITVPRKLNLTTTIHGGATPSTPQHQQLDFYTSLKDLLSPSTAISINSPKPPSPEISIRNRLVKQAAWAYLQPMSSSPDSSGHHFLLLRRMWDPVVVFAKFIRRNVILPIYRAFDRVVKAIAVGFDLKI